MLVISMFIKKLRSKYAKKNRQDDSCLDQQTDKAVIKIKDVIVALCRKATLDIPHEFSVFVPRVELRERYYKDNQLQYEEEMILSSLTIVHAPQDPPVESGRTNKPSKPIPQKHQKMD